MTRTFLSFLLFFFTLQSLHAQPQAAIDALALKVPQANTYATRDLAGYIQQNFTTDSARIRAIYVWITHNISYDLARVQARTTGPEDMRQPVADVLKTRSTVCQGYADLFVELCTAVGIKALFVGGYTRLGGVVNQIPHAWVGAQAGGQWYLFDPTWGAGHVQGNQFVRAFTNRFYKVAPAEMIKDHMPFDPMYQFLNHPITNKEFTEGQSTPNPARPVFNFDDTLQQFALLAPEEKLRSEARRLEANGVRNDLILGRLTYLKKALEPYAFQEANTSLQKAVTLFNQYISHKNQQFAGMEDKALQQLMDSVANYASQSRTLLQSVAPRDAAQRQAVTGTFQYLEKFQVQVVREKEFAARYLATDKASRLPLFGRK